MSGKRIETLNRLSMAPPDDLPGKGPTKINYKGILLLFLISIAILQQLPVIRDLFYSKIRLFLYVMFAIFSLVSLASLNLRALHRFATYMSLTAIYSIVLFLFKWFMKGVDPSVFEILIPLGVLLCSLNAPLNTRALNRFLKWYVLLATGLGVGSVFYYGEGLSIARSYLIPSKNQIGPVLGISAIIAGTWVILRRSGRKRTRALSFVILSLLVVALLTIRNRASLVGIAAMLLILFVREHKNELAKTLVILSLLLAILIVTLNVFHVFKPMMNYVWNSFALSYDVEDLNSISAGRIEGYRRAGQYIKKYPLFGDVESPRKFEIVPHNYILNKFVKYGIMGSLPIVLFYLYLWCFSLRKIVRNRDENDLILPFSVLLFSLIVSLFEYTYPYGPGTSQILAWFLLGQYLSRSAIRIKRTKEVPVYGIPGPKGIAHMVQRKGLTG